jgi:predicted O-linked N-acetylglucosamine transferase (SPINDLY family)
MNIQLVFNEKDNYNKILYRLIYKKFNIKSIENIKNDCQIILLNDYLKIDDNIINEVNKIKNKSIYFDGEIDIFPKIKNEPKFVIFNSKYLNDIKDLSNNEIFLFFKEKQHNIINLNYEIISKDTINKDDMNDLIKYYLDYNLKYNKFLFTLKQTNIDIYNFLVTYLLYEKPICFVLQIKELKDYIIIKRHIKNNIRALLWVSDYELFQQILYNAKMDNKLFNKLILLDGKYDKKKEKYSMNFLYHNEIVVKINDISILEKLNISNIRKLHEKNDLIVQQNYISYYRKLYDFLPEYLFYDNNNELITDIHNNKDIQYLVKNTKNKLVDNNFKIIYKFDIPNTEQILKKASLYMTEKRYDEGNDLIDNFIEKTSYNKITFDIIASKLSFSAMTKNIKNLDIYLNVMKDITISNIDPEKFKEIFKNFFNQLLTIILLIDIDKSKLKNFYFAYLKNSNIPTNILKIYMLFLAYIKDISIDDADILLEHFKNHYKQFNKEFLLDNEFKKILSLFFKILQKNNYYDNINKLIDILNDTTSLINIKDNTKLDLYLIYFKDYCPELIYNIYSNLDPYFETTQDIIENRDKADKNLDKLIETYKNINFTTDAKNIMGFYTNNFYFSYHGLSSKDYFNKKSNFFRLICPELNYKFTYISNKNNKIKVAFISDFLIRNHSVFKDRHQIIKKLSDDKRFDVYIITTADLIDNKQVFLKTNHIKIEVDLLKAKETIEKLNLDYLVYCEIGMNPFFYLLAHMKLAKIQINTWGHSDTSGIDTIDYFMSSKLYEIDSAQNHYSEKLITLNSLCTCYVNPMQKYNINDFKDRYFFGFSKKNNIYICPQSIFKLLPDFDEYLLGILEKDPNGILILQDAITGKKDKIIKRFEKFNKNLGRIHFIGSLQHHIYMNYIYIADVMLDPYPFGGCNSSFEAFSLGIPIVTRPSTMINGRFTNGFYNKLNIFDLICHSKEEYIEKAIKLTSDIEFKNNIIKKIKENSNLLFTEEESFTEWRDFFIKNN